jgi:hypothetical protein
MNENSTNSSAGEWTETGRRAVSTAAATGNPSGTNRASRWMRSEARRRITMPASVCAHARPCAWSHYRREEACQCR